MASDSTQYLIDIAAEMAGGDSTVSQLQQIASRLAGAGSAAQVFDTALARTRDALKSTETSSVAAAAALKDGEQKYAELEKAADKAAKALERAAMKGKATPELEQRAQAATSALRGEATALDQLRAKASAATAEHSRMRNAMKELEAAAKAEAKALENAEAKAAGSGKVNEMAEALGKLGGPVGTVGQQVLGLFEGFGKLGGSLGTAAGAALGAAVAVVALGAAVVALGAAIATAIVKTAIWAVGLADARRNAALASEALSKTSGALKDIGTVVPAVASGVTLATEDLQDLAKQLDAAKVSAADMPAALRAVALAEDALGKGGAAKFIEELKSGKKTVAELSKEMEDKFGGIVGKKLLSLDAQSKKLKSNLAATFGGLNIEPLLAQLAKLVALFDQNTSMGKTLKWVFESLFQPLIDAAAKAVPVLEAFLLGVAIGALKIYIAFKPATKQIKEMFGAADGGGLPSALEIALFLGKGLAAAIGLVVVGLGIFAAAVAAPIMAFMRLYAAGIVAWETIKAGASMAVAYLESISLSDVASNMIQGLADGITNGADKVVTALKGVVQRAISAAKTALGIASPSKVFEGLGDFTAQGFAQGVEGGAGQAQAAMQSMVEPPSSAQAPAGGTTVGGHTFHVTFSGGESSSFDDQLSKFRAMLVEVLEGNVVQAGGGAVPA